MRELNHTVEGREQVLAQTLAWLSKGVELSQAWISFVPDNQVPAYIKFCTEPSPDGADIVNDCVNNVKRLTITEIAEM